MKSIETRSPKPETRNTGSVRDADGDEPGISYVWWYIIHMCNKIYNDFLYDRMNENSISSKVDKTPEAESLNTGSVRDADGDEPADDADDAAADG